MAVWTVYHELVRAEFVPHGGTRKQDAPESSTAGFRKWTRAEKHVHLLHEDVPEYSRPHALFIAASQVFGGLRVPRQIRLLQRLVRILVVPATPTLCTWTQAAALLAVAPKLKTKPLMTEFSVKSTIISRYAFTTVSCRMLNRASEDQDVEFLMQIPAAAFITNFTMEKGTDTFRASAVIPSKGKAVFLLTYEELLQRRLGKYEHVVSVRPQQLVGRLTVEVNILERSGLSSLEVLPLHDTRHRHSGRAEELRCLFLQGASPAGRDPDVMSVWMLLRVSKSGAGIRVDLASCRTRTVVTAWIIIDSWKGMARFGLCAFARKESGGYVRVSSIIQCRNDSGARKLTASTALSLPLKSSESAIVRNSRKSSTATKDALFTILHDLRPQDHFSIIGFSNRIKVWKDHLVAVTPDSIRDGKVYIHHMSPTGVQGHVTDAGMFSRTAPDASSPPSRPFAEAPPLSELGSVILLRFYDEIRTPLLSDIRVGYPPRLVQQATRTFFPNYFNGSEIIIAGKLADGQLDRLRVEVTASNSKKFVVLKTDVPVEPQRAGSDGPGGARPEDAGEAGPNHLERLWSYLTVRELLSSWLQSGAGQEKERLRQKAQALAVNSRFLTPFTSMKLTKVLPTKRLEGAFGVSAVTGPGTAVQSLPPAATHPGPALKKPYDPRIKVSRTSADGDPHFVVDFPASGLTVCFNIDGQPGDILRLVSDHTGSGVTVNGQLVGAPAPPGGHKKQRTYFQTITVLVTKPARSYLEVTPHRVILDGEDRLVLPCNQSAAVGSRGLELSVSANASVTVTIQGTIAFVILIHLYRKPAAYQRDHLGFYVASGRGLSGSCHGLLGQFLNQEARLTGAPAQLSPNSTGPAPPQMEILPELPRNKRKMIPSVTPARAPEPRLDRTRGQRFFVLMAPVCRTVSDRRDESTLTPWMNEPSLYEIFQRGPHVITHRSGFMQM
ncbi:inter-alpha-trypsin inhibitor heavy chain H5 [Pteropus vampyrus]|uniref:Inter-alpha-trypsin inhibitor heavy chain H5 n=1 Tax=Pteropus vampyrus TaxID=132908 RepID=A0A6P3QCF3_PTEVA|nr:inter-alpha-trypsin inhibitor heavy chain H5 [Pteropus vampyrus]